MKVINQYKMGVSKKLAKVQRYQKSSVKSVFLLGVKHTQETQGNNFNIGGFRVEM